MPATTDQQPSADSSGTPATVGGGITRLNPSDGLFLRAQHLTTMEDYARQLSLAVGVAAGTGVVYGYHVWLEDTTLKVDAGLAIAPDGRPLRSGLVAEFDISGLAVTDDEFFVVEVAPAGWDFGQENMYGNLCTDPCSQGGQIQPYRAEAKEYRKLFKGPLDGNGRRSLYLKVTRHEGTAAVLVGAAVNHQHLFLSEA